MQECFFLENSDKRIFGCLYGPNDKNSHNGIGLILCPPFAEEMMWSQRVLTNLARYLAEKNYMVFCLDYYGTGDSGGRFEELTISSQLEDIDCIVDLMKLKMGVSKVGLLGLRFGGTLSVVYSELKRKNDFLIVWEPVIQIEKYLKKCLRSNLSSQMITQKKISYTRDQMIKDLKRGVSVNIDGYLMSGKFYEEGSAIDLTKISLGFKGPVLIINISPSKSRGIPKKMDAFRGKYLLLNSKSEFLKIQEKPFWSDIKIYYQRSNNLFDATLEFLNRLNLN